MSKRPSKLSTGRWTPHAACAPPDGAPWVEGCVRPWRVGAFDKRDGYEWVKYLAVGTELALSVVAGLYLGSLVDRWLGLGTPWFTILGLVAGIVSGFTVLVRVLGRGDGTNRDESD